MLTIPIKKDIDWFYKIPKKAENDLSNSIRENILLFIFNREESELNEYISDPIYGIKWKILIKECNKVLNKIIIKIETELKLKGNYDFDVIKIGGRKNNDFTLKIYQDDKEIFLKKLEFKFNTNKITNIPEVVSLYENNVEYNGIKYNEYFYDNIILKLIIEYPELGSITKEEYLKHINTSNDISKYSFLNKLQTIREKDPKKFDKKYFYTSLDEYLKLSNECPFKVDNIRDKIKEKVMDKEFIMWKPDINNINNSKFYNERLDENLDNLKFECIVGSTTKNTIILSTGNIKFHCLLRWKNHNCIRGTAWQISVK